jgi:chromosome segregation ATPase
MPSFYIIAIGAIIVICGLLALLLLLPTERVYRKMPKKTVPKAEESQGKDWQEVSLRLERHIQGLRKEVQDGRRREKELEREMSVQKEKHAKLQEKLSQERGWQEKEQGSAEKRSREVLTLKAEIKNLEESVEKEHIETLRMAREILEFKDSLAAATDVRRSLEVQIAKLKTDSENDRKELRDLREANAKLSRKQDEDIWVAKAEYIKIETELKNKERELAKLREQLRRETL